MSVYLLEKTSKVLDTVAEWTGRTLAWLLLAMVLVMFLNVVQRYVFNTGAIWQQELVRYFHAAVFLGASGYTLLWDKHVRVDIFYHNFSERGKAWVNLIGTLLFMFPVCIGILVLSYHFVLDSWAIREGSGEYNGLSGVYVLKTAIWLCAGTFLLQSVSICCKSLIILKGKNN